jgi:serine/threonine-protein kinase RsbW
VTVSSTIILKLPSQMDFLGVPDAVLMEIGSDLDCCKRSLEELGTSIIEACTNAMEHGNKLDEETPIEVVFEMEERKVSVTVYDHGPGFDYQGWQPSEELMRERGRGILIMREFTDDLQFGQHPDGRFFIKLVKILEPSEDED